MIKKQLIPFCICFIIFRSSEKIIFRSSELNRFQFIRKKQNFFKDSNFLDSDIWMGSEKQRVIKTKYFHTRLKSLLPYIKCLRRTKFFFVTYSLCILLMKPQITKPHNWRIIIGCSSLKFLSKRSHWKEKEDVGVLTVASRQKVTGTHVPLSGS